MARLVRGHVDPVCVPRGVVINPIVVAEVSAGFESIEDVEAALPETYFVVSRSRARWRFWLARRSCSTGGAAVPSRFRSRISTSARTPRSQVTRC